MTTQHIFMAQDPQTHRVAVQIRPFAGYDFPPGHRGEGWEEREHDVDKALLSRMLNGNLVPETQDRLHREWWSAAGPTDWEPVP